MSEVRCPTFALRLGLALVWFVPAFAFGQTSYHPEGSEYRIAGSLIGDQIHVDAAIQPSGGWIVWEDSFTDGDGLGISARRLGSSLAGTFGAFRVNQVGALDQERPRVSMLNDGGGVFVWQGGKLGFQRIYARFLSSSNTWASGDVLVNTFANNSQLDAAVATLTGGNVAVVWASVNQVSATSMQDVYLQRLSPTGQKLGSETLVNQATAFNQRTPAIAPLTDGRFVVVWVTEQQRFENSVDIYARFFSADGVGVGNEFLVNTGTNICANPSVAAAANGGFAVAWGQKDLEVLTNSWDVFARTVSSAGTGGLVRRVNTQTYGDQFAPKISSVGNDYLVVWTSLGQDGSREGVFGQHLSGDGSLAGGEFGVNTTTASQQIQPVVTSDHSTRFLTVWTSFVGGSASFDLFSQRFAATTQPLAAPEAPLVGVLSSNALNISWPPLQGFSVLNYEVYADGAATPTAVVTNSWWTMTGLAPSSPHWFNFDYVLTDGRHSPLSGATTNTTYGPYSYYGIPVEWMSFYFGNNWPSASADSDGDGVSNLNEFLAGTNPTDANSVLIQHLRATPQGLFLDWNTEPGLIYQVQVSGNLGGWTNLGVPRFAAGYQDSIYVGGSASSFYRIQRLR